MTWGRRPRGGPPIGGPSGGRRPAFGARPGAVALLAGLAVISALGSCQPGESLQPSPTGATSPVAELRWQEVGLPDGLDPVTVVAVPGGVLVGAQAPAKPRARLLVLDDGRWAQIGVEPHTPYAFEARWVSLAVRGDRLEAIGGARGGAHANVRWTVWSGTWTGPRARVAEQPQPFGVFGGWGAGDLTGIAFAGDQPVVIGAWQSDRTGNDVSIWTRHADRWTRQSSTGTPLGSTPAMLQGARAVAARGRGLALAGSVTELAQGSVAVRPAIWLSEGWGAPWRLVRLPARGTLAEGHALACLERTCLVVGVDDGQLAAWEVRDDGSVARVPIPAVAVADGVSLPTPLVTESLEAVVAPGVLLQRATDPGAGHGANGGWLARAAPAGAPIGLAGAGDAVYVITAGGADAASGHLWTATP